MRQGVRRWWGRRIMGWGGAAALMVLSWTSCRPSDFNDSPPNVVLIIIDTARADYLSCYGFQRPTSPQLDEMAKRGTRFTRALVQCTWTRPSIGSMLTALYPRTLGLYSDGDEVFADRFITLPEVLKEHGFTTIGATANPNINSFYLFHQGFDYYMDTDVVFRGMHMGKDQKVSDHLHHLPTAAEVFDALLAAVEERGNPPYYLQANIMEVHEFRNRYVDYGAEFEQLFPEESDPRIRRYMMAMRVISHEIDRFVGALEQKPGWENTLFVITSDHGETVADHPALKVPKGHGWLVYQSQALVPLLMFGGGKDRIPAGREIARPVRLLDIAPTVLELCGMTFPDAVDGVSLVPLLSDPDAEIDLPGAFVVETKYREADKMGVYRDGWLYVENRDRHQGTDPRELQKWGSMENGARTNQLAANPEEARQLTDYLRSWEESHPAVPPTMAATDKPASLHRQLEAIGYVR